MKVQNLFALFLAGLLVAVLGNTAAASDKPNVVLMLADNVGWGDIGAFSGGEVRGMPTPNIDRLASEGKQMTQFFVEPGCTPSRAGLMTERYSSAERTNEVIVPFSLSSMMKPNRG